MIPFNHEFIRFNDELYDVIRKYPETKVKPDKIDDLRQHLSCDVTLRKEGMLYYCRKIQEVHPIQ